jgi:hypothetical protein
VKKLLFFLAFLKVVPAFTQCNYNAFFTDKRFRFNFFIEGNFNTAIIKSDNIREESTWSGSKKNLIDTFEYGEYFYKIIDLQSKQVIFSRGFSDLFVEWQTTDEAKDTTVRYHDCILFPAPKNSFILEIFKRDTTESFSKLFDTLIDPTSLNILKLPAPETRSKNIRFASESSKALDIVFLSEGYTIGQENKFYSDAERFKDYLFSWEPYKQFTEKINFLAVFSPSTNEGVDIPGENIWVSTIVDAHFYTFGIERYLTLPDLCKVYDYLQDYPVDQVCILVNSSKYGGGGIYNFYDMFAAENEHTELLFLHEFGHGFASLGDEYFNSPVAYTEFGSNNYEPYEPNITNLVDFKSKWSDMVLDTIPIPTPDKPEYDNIVGVFEGANYISKGFYRPQRNCAMRSTGIKHFCKVCEKCILEMLKFYTE